MEIVHRNVRLHNTFLRYEIELSVDDSDRISPRLGIVRESLAPLRMESLPEPMRAVCADYVVEGEWNGVNDNIFVTYPLRRCEEGVPTIYVLDTTFDEGRDPYDSMDSIKVDGMETTALSMADLDVPPEVRAVRREMASWRFFVPRAERHARRGQRRRGRSDFGHRRARPRLPPSEGAARRERGLRRGPPGRGRPGRYPESAGRPQWRSSIIGSYEKSPSYKPFKI